MERNTTLGTTTRPFGSNTAGKGRKNPRDNMGDTTVCTGTIAEMN